MKILIVEDEKILARFLQEIFESGGHQVEIASNFKQAKTILNTSFRVVILDGNFPVFDKGEVRTNGPPLAQEIKDKFPEIKVIGFSADSNLNFGDFFILKGHPDSTKKLVNVVEGIEDVG